MAAVLAVTFVIALVALPGGQAQAPEASDEAEPDPAPVPA